MTQDRHVPVRLHLVVSLQHGQPCLVGRDHERGRRVGVARMVFRLAPCNPCVQLPLVHGHHVPGGHHPAPAQQRLRDDQRISPRRAGVLFIESAGQDEVERQMPRLVALRLQTPGAVVPRRFRLCPPFECSPGSLGELPRARFALCVLIRAAGVGPNRWAIFRSTSCFADRPACTWYRRQVSRMASAGTTTQLPADSCVAHRNRLTPCRMNRFASMAIGLVRASSGIALSPSDSVALYL